MKTDIFWNGLKRHENALSDIKTLEEELDDAKNQPDPFLSKSSLSSTTAERSEVSRLTSEIQFLRQSHDAQSQAIEGLKDEMEGLLDTLKELHNRQEILEAEKEVDKERILMAEEMTRDWKDRYESVKTELRNFKGEIASRKR